jgi:ribonuclease-3
VKIANELKEFEQRIGVFFQDPALLVQAVTHSSVMGAMRRNNERLEFLGDRVLGLVMAEAMLLQDTEAKEGILAPRFNALVRKETCADVARQIGLGDVLKLGRSEQQTGGRRKEALLGNAMEAVIGAIYLDQGLETAKGMIIREWGARIDNVEEDARDAKSTLQEWAQARGQDLPKYELIARSGPDHAPQFEIQVRVASGQAAQAKANSKRNAEHAAAASLLAQLKENS